MPAPSVSAEQQFVGLGKLEWTALPPPHDLPLWQPALRAALASDGAELSCTLPALSVRRSAVVSDSAAQGAGGPIWPPCHGRGRFDQAVARCQCRAGYGGDSCEQPIPQRCNDDRKRCVPGRAKPGMTTSGALGERPSCTEWTRVLSRCSAQVRVRVRVRVSLTLTPTLGLSLTLTLILTLTSVTRRSTAACAATGRCTRGGT